MIFYLGFLTLLVGLSHGLCKFLNRVCSNFAISQKNFTVGDAHAELCFQQLSFDDNAGNSVEQPSSFGFLREKEKQNKTKWLH